MLSTARTNAVPVSVVVPTKDRPTLLADTLRTVRAQEGVPIEVVVVDDGSTDAAAVESVVAGLQDSRLRLVRHPSPAGVSAARNTGLTVTSGEGRLLRRRRPLGSGQDHPTAEGPGSVEMQLGVHRSRRHQQAQRGHEGLSTANPRHGGRGSAEVQCHPWWLLGVLVARTVLAQVGAFDVELGPARTGTSG